MIQIEGVMAFVLVCGTAALCHFIKRQCARWL